MFQIFSRAPDTRHDDTDDAEECDEEEKGEQCMIKQDQQLSQSQHYSQLWNIEETVTKINSRFDLHKV